MYYCFKFELFVFSLYTGNKIVFCSQKITTAIQTVFESFFNVFYELMKAIQIDKSKFRQMGIDIKVSLEI